MKSSLPQQIRTKEEAKNFLNHLYSNGEINLVQDTFLELVGHVPHLLINQIANLKEDIAATDLIIYDYINKLTGTCVESWQKDIDKSVDLFTGQAILSAH